jgi:hypothetical protein
MNRILVITAVLSITLCTGCKKEDKTSPEPGKSVYTIAILSDPHYMDPSLLIKKGQAFTNYLKTDGKLLAESDALMQEAISELLKAKPDVVLVPGDLTKDGELVSHLSVASYLDQLIRAGIKVRVTDGNHDINSVNAKSFNDSTSTQVPNIGMADFRMIYSDCGFSDALYIDPASLSYVSEPIPNMWILAIDACEYYNNDDPSHTAGKIKPETMTWILARLDEAAQKGKTVFGMMHHEILVHFDGQKTYFPGFVLDGNADACAALMNAGLKIMFTGHFHATDIVDTTIGNKVLYDIETGSIVVYPCSYRMVTYIKDSALVISNRHITTINYDMGGKTFPEYASQKTWNNMDTLLTIGLKGMNPAPDSILIGIMSPRMTNSTMAHYYGDELRSAAETDLDTAAVALASAAGFSWLGSYLDGLWTDLVPRDSTLTIRLKSGTSVKRLPVK